MLFLCYSADEKTGTERLSILLKATQPVEDQERFQLGQGRMEVMAALVPGLCFQVPDLGLLGATVAWCITFREPVVFTIESIW